MAGQPQPTRLLKAFAADAVSDDITLPIPEPSQISIDPGAASLTDGFPPACFTDPASGGVLPSGADFNGVLNMATGPAAYLMAGQIPFFDSELSDFMDGYAVGATVQSALNQTVLWINVSDGNTNDPDVDSTGWMSNSVLYSTLVPSAGTHNNQALPGWSDYCLDIDTSAGNVTYTGFVALRPGQKLTICNVGANTLTLSPLTGSAAPNQIRMSTGGITVLQNDSITIQWIQALQKWVQV